MDAVSRGQGKTILFVSHNPEMVTSLCTMGIVLAGGGLIFSGKVDEAIKAYDPRPPSPGCAG
jgi:lipopolysaccharide transport system ATP-binding protein